MSDLRVVIDTSVAISAALVSQSLPRKVVDFTLASGRLLVSSDTISELDEVFRRPKFNKYVSEELRLEFLAALILQAELVEIAEIVTDCRDPKDNKFLELGVSGTATHIVSGDADLLTLDPFRGIRIITPRAFLHAAMPADDETASPNP